MEFIFSNEILQSCGWFCFFRKKGIEIKNLDVTSGDITVNLKEDILLKKKSELSLSTDRRETIAPEQIVAKKSNSVESLKKKIFMCPEKVRWFDKIKTNHIFIINFFFYVNQVVKSFFKSKNCLFMMLYPHLLSATWYQLKIIVCFLKGFIQFVKAGSEIYTPRARLLCRK